MSKKIEVNSYKKLGGGKLFQIGHRAGYKDNPFFMKKEESIYVTGNQLLAFGVAATLFLCGGGAALLYFATR